MNKGLLPYLTSLTGPYLAAGRITTIAGLVLVAGLAGCGGASVSSNSGTQVQKTVSIPTTLALSTTTAAGTTQSAMLTNTGNAAVNITGISITGANASNFGQTNTCGAQVAVSASCSVTVSFAASTAGVYMATLTVANDASTGGSAVVALTGTATAPTPAQASLNATAFPFPTTTAGGTSGLQTATLSNPGGSPLTIGSIALSGTGANLFKETTTCGATLAAGGSCTINATFAPKVAGTYAAIITVTDNAAIPTQTIALNAVATPSVITIDTSTASDWKINNGAMMLDWNSTGGNIFGIQMVGTSDTLVDAGHTGSNGQPSGLYMDNTGIGAGTTSATYTNSGTYLDWSITTASNATTNPFTYSEHFVVYPNDPGIHIYFVVNHSATDIAGGLGQIQYVFRDSLTQFTNTYTVDESLGNPGVQTVPLPQNSEMFSTDPGRAVSDATVDLHGFTDLPAGFTRKFYTKYDYSSYEYLHKAHGLFGTKYGAWTVLQGHDTQPGGPTKQSLIFTGNLLMMEAWSGHLDNSLSLNFTAGQVGSHLFGPFYIHFNTFGQAYTQAATTLATPADMYADALQAGAAFVPQYDSEAQLQAAGYVPSTARGSVSLQMTGVTGQPHTAWAVLSDPAKNFQVSSAGYEYWADISASGSATIAGVAPGTYRLSVYDLGQWGELRQENIVVRPNQTTIVPTTAFVAENFGSGAPVFSIGTPDRSSHEFLHGHDASGHDDKEFWGAFNYWADFAANNGAVIYNATSGPAGAATNDLTKWNYSHWGNSFNPGLFGGVYSTSDDTTDGYTYAIPAYVAALTGHTGTNGVLTPLPPWQVHFATPATQTGSTAQSYVVLSVAVACAEGSYVVTLNGQQLVWHYTNASDCGVRSGLSGYTQWFAMQWNASVLNPAGQDNVLTISMSQTQGSEDDALRLELTNVSADPAVRSWNDYTYIYGSTTTLPNDAIANP
jgi:rhamnogalacturonan endolyase